MLFTRQNESHLLPAQNLPFDRTGFSESWQRSQEQMRELFNSVVAIDLDGTIYDEPTNSLRPGVIDVFKDMQSAGNSLHVWSIRTKHTVGPVVVKFGLSGLVDGVHDKPFMFDRSVEAVERTLGFVPDVTVDNEIEERIIGGNVGFLLVPTYYPRENAHSTVERIA